MLKKIRISALKDACGNIITDQNGLEEIAVNFYKDLFSAQMNSEPNEVLQHVSTRVTQEMNEALTRPFTEDFRS